MMLGGSRTVAAPLAAVALAVALFVVHEARLHWDFAVDAWDRVGEPRYLAAPISRTDVVSSGAIGVLGVVAAAGLLFVAVRLARFTAFGRDHSPAAWRWIRASGGVVLLWTLVFALFGWQA